MRATLLILLLANAGYFTWSQGHWLGLGGRGSWADPAPLREPERLDQQNLPDRLTILVTSPPSTPSAQKDVATGSEDSSPVCLQASLANDEHAAALRGALAASGMAEDSWQLDTTVQPARWVVYLGKFASAEALRTRKAELRAAKVDHRDINNPALQPGLALGTFPTETAATQALRDVTRNGIKNAKVVAERPESRQHTLTLPRATPALQGTVQGINAGLSSNAAFDWQPCPG